MRHYDRADFRHLNDAERYRDYDYVADDGFIGPNERAPYGYARDDVPPWSTQGEWQTRPFAGEDVIERERGQGREYGRDRGLGFGRSYDPKVDVERSGRDDYARGFPHPLRVEDGRVRPGDVAMPPPSDRMPRARRRARPVRLARTERRAGVEPRGGILNAMLHPRQAMERVVRGFLYGYGTSPRGLTDAEIRIHDEVRERLARHPDVDARAIDVTVAEGEVTLEGTVATRAMKRCAEDATEQVAGVEDIHNQLRIVRRPRG